MLAVMDSIRKDAPGHISKAKHTEATHSNNNSMSHDQRSGKDVLQAHHHRKPPDSGSHVQVWQ